MQLDCVCVCARCCLVLVSDLWIVTRGIIAWLAKLAKLGRTWRADVGMSFNFSAWYYFLMRFYVKHYINIILKFLVFILFNSDYYYVVLVTCGVRFGCKFF